MQHPPRQEEGRDPRFSAVETPAMGCYYFADEVLERELPVTNVRRTHFADEARESALTNASRVYLDDEVLEAAATNETRVPASHWMH